VVVVGGGVIGLAVGRELAREGVRSVCVVERHDAPGTESSARANGGVRAQFTTRVNIEFSRHTIAALEELDRETDGLPGLNQAGYLLMTGTEEGENGLHGGLVLQKLCGVASEWLSSEQVLEKAPFVRPDGLRGGAFCAKDGFVDPHGMISALHQQGRKEGVQFLFERRVDGIRREGEGFVVTVDGGEIRADWVVNAAGSDAAEVGGFLGVEIPVEPIRRNLACTPPVPGYPDVFPMLVDVDTGVLIRRETGGFVVAYSNPDDPPGRDISFDPRFFEDIATRVGNRFPFLEEVPFDAKRCWAGLYPETPDHHAIVGPAPGIPRFLQAVGFGGHGLMHALAAGRAIAELVARGRSETLNIRQLRLERFAEGDLIVESAVL
jgi:sarcosine oxidase subunit beta